MAFKVPVEDRISTYPGRVKLTPVNESEHIYDLERADMPLVEGTPINKVLFDSKADTLTENVTLVVSTTGSDANGNGTMDAPFQTIQKAVDSLPKNLGGYTATVSIDLGMYAERVTVKDFHSGRLVISKPGELAIINGIDIINSSVVETNIYQIERASGSSRPLFVAQDGSNVFVGSDMILDGIDMGVSGMIVERNSSLATGTNVTLTFNNCGTTATAQWCSFVSVNKITGSENMFGMVASQGGIVTYKTDTTSKNWSNAADSGGLVLTGQNSTDLSDATLDL